MTEEAEEEQEEETEEELKEDQELLGIEVNIIREEGPHALFFAVAAGCLLSLWLSGRYWLPLLRPKSIAQDVLQVIACEGKPKIVWQMKNGKTAVGNWDGKNWSAEVVAGTNPAALCEL